MTFLGHKVSCQGIANIEKAKSFPAPRNTSEVQSFLGLASYYRKRLKNFPDVAEPLHRLLHKDLKFEWNDACQLAFESLRSSFTRNPVLAYPDFSETFQFQTDASKWAVGAVLSQRRRGTERVLAFASSALSRTERYWSTYDREFYAIVWAIRHFRPYLGGAKFVVMTDH